MKQQSTSLVRARCIERRTDTNALTQGNIHVLLSSPYASSVSKQCPRSCE